MRNRILIISNVTAGLASFRSELIEALSEEYDVFILASDNGRKEKLVAAGAKVIPMKLDRHGINPFKEVRLAAFYKKRMKEISPKIVLTYTIKPNIYGGIAAASYGIPYVANITGLGPAIENGGPLQKITIMLYRFGLRKAQKVFFQNTANRDFMVQHRIVKQYDLLPGSGVNLKKYTVQPYPHGETVDFVFISRIIREKGIDQYLEAAGKIRKRHPETRFQKLHLRQFGNLT